MIQTWNVLQNKGLLIWARQFHIFFNQGAGGKGGKGARFLQISALLGKTFLIIGSWEVLKNQKERWEMRRRLSKTCKGIQLTIRNPSLQETASLLGAS